MQEQEPAVWFALTKAHLYFPGKLSSSTIRNWATRGIESKLNGKLVYLKTKQVGGRVLTSIPCYHKFIEDLNKEERE